MSGTENDSSNTLHVGDRRWKRSPWPYKNRKTEPSFQWILRLREAVKAASQLPDCQILRNALVYQWSERRRIQNRNIARFSGQALPLWII